MQSVGHVQQHFTRNGILGVTCLTNFWTFAMCGFIQGGPSLRVCMFAKVFQTYAKSILVQEVETMHHTDFTNNDIFHLLSGFVSRGGSSGIYAKSHQTIGKTITFGNIVDHPSFHKTCIFFCQQISLFQLLHCVQTLVNKTITLCVPVGQTNLHNHTSTH